MHGATSKDIPSAISSLFGLETKCTFNVQHERKGNVENSNSEIANEGTVRWKGGTPPLQHNTLHTHYILIHHLDIKIGS